MGNKKINDYQGFWILSKMGKKVLRPGGRALTRRMISELSIKSTDDVVEFAPGMGYTAGLILAKNPKSYTGVELNEEAADDLRKKFKGQHLKFITANASDSGLPAETADVLLGEAMLTMHADQRKAKIIKEAYRILKPGGYYAIHELGLTPDTLPEKDKARLQKSMARLSQVNARPLTTKEWRNLLEENGFTVLRGYKTSMDLLKVGRLLNDEGFFGALKVIVNVATHKKERKRILEMRRRFKEYEDHIQGISLIAVKKKEVKGGN